MRKPASVIEIFVPHPAEPVPNSRAIGLGLVRLRVVESLTSIPSRARLSLYLSTGHRDRRKINHTAELPYIARQTYGLLELEGQRAAATVVNAARGKLRSRDLLEEEAECMLLA